MYLPGKPESHHRPTSYHPLRALAFRLVDVLGTLGMAPLDDA